MYLIRIESFSLMLLSTTTHHNCYVKLIVSSLDYSINSHPRQILAQTLQCSLESSRLYATQFLNVLLRARQKAGEMNNKQYMSPFKNCTFDRESPSLSEGDLSESQKQTSYQKNGECPGLDVWILELLIKQARDESKAVSLAALNILDEACNVPVRYSKIFLYKF